MLWLFSMVVALFDESDSSSLYPGMMLSEYFTTGFTELICWNVLFCDELCSGSYWLWCWLRGRLTLRVIVVLALW